MKHLVFVLAIVLCVSIFGADAYEETTFNNDFMYYKGRYEYKRVNELRANASTSVQRIKQQLPNNPPPGWYWYAYTSVWYGGDDLFYRGNYSTKVVIRYYHRNRSGTYEGRWDSIHWDRMALSVTPPPQNGTNPDIDNCEAVGEITGTDPDTGDEIVARADIE